MIWIKKYLVQRRFMNLFLRLIPCSLFCLIGNPHRALSKPNHINHKSFEKVSNFSEPSVVDELPLNALHHIPPNRDLSPSVWLTVLWAEWLMYQRFTFDDSKAARGSRSRQSLRLKEGSSHTKNHFPRGAPQMFASRIKNSFKVLVQKLSEPITTAV